MPQLQRVTRALEQLFGSGGATRSAITEAARALCDDAETPVERAAAELRNPSTGG